MKQEKGMESVKPFCPTETVIRDCMRTAKGMDRYDTRERERERWLFFKVQSKSTTSSVPAQV